MTGIVNAKNMRLTALVYDMAMAGLAMYAALILRLGTFEGLDNYSLVGAFNGLDDYSLVFGAILPFVAAAAVSLLTLGTYRTSWLHASTADLTNIVKAVTLAVLIYMPIGFVVNRLYLIPRTSIVLAWMVFLLLMAGSRIGYRLFREGHLFFARHPMAPGQVPILIVGGGVDAKNLLLSLEDHASEYYPVGVLDDGVDGNLLGGVPVLGKVTDVERVVKKFSDAGDRPRKLVVVDRTLPPAPLHALVESADRLGLTVARGPDPTRFRPGTSDAPELQPVSVEDLLGRPQIVLDPTPVHRFVAGRRVLVTGAGGSIGSEIVRQVCAIGPAAICLVDASEFNLYTIDAEVSEQWPAIERVARVSDVRLRVLQARDRVPCRGAEARPAGRGQSGRGHLDQRDRHAPRLRRRGRGRLPGDGADLDLQGSQPHERDGRQQAVRRRLLPGDGARACRPAGGDTLRGGAVRQRPRLERLGRSPVRAPVEGGRAADGDASRHRTLLHDYPGGGPARAAGLGAGRRGHRPGGAGVRPRHGQPDEDRRPGAPDDPAGRPSAGEGRGDRVHGLAAGRKAVRGIVPRRRTDRAHRRAARQCRQSADAP